MSRNNIIPFPAPVHLVQIEPLSVIDLVKSMSGEYPTRLTPGELTAKVEADATRHGVTIKDYIGGFNADF